MQRLISGFIRQFLHVSVYPLKLWSVSAGFHALEHAGVRSLGFDQQPAAECLIRREQVVLRLSTATSTLFSNPSLLFNPIQPS